MNLISILLITLSMNVFSSQMSSSGSQKYIIDVQNQKITFYYSYDLEPAREYEVSYEQIKGLFPKNLFPEQLTDQMVFNTEFILETLKIINRISPIGFVQGDIMSYLKNEEGNLYLINYSLQYFHYRSDYYSIRDMNQKQEYINYFGNHEIGKPAITRVLLGNKFDVKLSNIRYMYSNHHRSYVLFFNLNDTELFLAIRGMSSWIEDKWQNDFCKKNTHLLNYREDDPGLNWRLFYSKFAGYFRGSKYLNCLDYKCFKQVYIKNEGEIGDLKNLVKFNNHAEQGKKLNFKNDYVPLFLSVSRIESGFYRQLSSYSYILVELNINDPKNFKLFGNGIDNIMNYEF